MESNIELKIRKQKDLIYEIQVPINSQISAEYPQYLTKVIKLGLSGGQLVVKVGGGYFEFLEYLDRKGILLAPYQKNVMITSESHEIGEKYLRNFMSV